jgi:hypothetical protein
MSLSNNYEFRISLLFPRKVFIYGAGAVLNALHASGLSWLIRHNSDLWVLGLGCVASAAMHDV